MTWLILGLILFLLPHSLREMRLREAIAGAFPSAGAYKGAYSLFALAGLGLIIWGKSIAPFVMIWEPPFNLRYVSHFIMLPVFLLWLAGMLPGNLLRVHVRNPMLLGTVFWGVAHLWANGDLASMLLFGSFTVWALVKFLSLWPSTEPPRWRSSMVWWDCLISALALALFIGVFMFHGELFGVGLVL